MSDTETGASETQDRRWGRRRLIMGATAASAGAAASVLAGADPAAAATGKPVLLGKANTATGATSVSASGGDGLAGRSSAKGKSGVSGTDASTGGGYGVHGTSAHGTGVYGSTTATGKPGVQGVDASSSGGYGVLGTSTIGDGVHGSSARLNGVSGVTSGGPNSGVSGSDISGAGGFGVTGSSVNGTGMSGYSSGGDGVDGITIADGQNGVFGQDKSTGGGYGVQGYSVNGSGVYGTTPNGFAVYAVNNGPNGGYGVVAQTTYGTGMYTYSQHGTALDVEGDAQVTGNLSKGGGSFRIDHPLDPAGKYLYHSFVESPDMKNVYDGTAALDSSGQAEVILPDWFEALNRDYRYQLTALDAPAPSLHIATRIAGGRFTIAGGQPGQHISWQVTGTRQDAWANAHRIPVEVTKPDQDQGRYLHPTLFPGGQPVTELLAGRPLPAQPRRSASSRPPRFRPDHGAPADSEQAVIG